MDQPGSRGQAWEMFLNPAQPADSGEDAYWEKVCSRIASGQLIPIISGGMVYDMVFSKMLEGSAEDVPQSVRAKPSATDVLSLIWANRIPYPFPDTGELGRVAQFVRSKYGAIVEAREAFRNFMKAFLLEYASRFGGDPDQIAELREQNELDNYTFGQLVTTLNILKLGPGSSDPLSILAGLPLPIYITTSYHDLLEQALVAMEKKPVQAVCYWAGQGPSKDDLDQLFKDYKPRQQAPLVFHLYGMETDPLTMLLSEDDYLDFIVQFTLNRLEGELIPSFLKGPLSQSWLMLLGYHLDDWDFRTLFRTITTMREQQKAGTLSTIIQLSLANQYDLPGDQTVRTTLTQRLNEAQLYLEKYFTPMSFEVHWDDPTGFLSALQKQWKDRRQK